MRVLIYGIRYVFKIFVVENNIVILLIPSTDTMTVLRARNGINEGRPSGTSGAPTKSQFLFI